MNYPHVLGSINYVVKDHDDWRIFVVFEDSGCCGTAEKGSYDDGQKPEKAAEIEQSKNPDRKWVTL
jgi:hypothetical protein